MYFRFGTAIVLVVSISLVGIALEKRNLELRRAVSRQHFRMDVLREVHANLRLTTQELGAPTRLIDALESGEMQLKRPEVRDESAPRRVPLLQWQRPVTP